MSKENTKPSRGPMGGGHGPCLLYTSDAADEEDSVDLGGPRNNKKKTKNNKRTS